MKKILLLLTLLISYSTYSQTENVDSLTENVTSKLVCKTVDEFSDETSFSTIQNVVLYEDGGDMKNQGLILMLFLSEKKGNLSPSTLYMRVVGMGGCVDEGSTLDVIFENGEKTKLVNWKKFNCEGKNYFSIKNKEDLFKNNKLKAIKFTNSRDYKSMVVKTNMDEEGSSYVMNTLLELDKINNGEITVDICEE